MTQPKQPPTPAEAERIANNFFRDLSAPERKAQRRRVVLIVALVLAILLACGQCWFDAGVAFQIGRFNACVYPPHTCNN